MIEILAGQYFDAETGLHYNYHRYYDPATGRYISPDPIGLFGGINLYAYVQNNPVNSTDTLGLYQSSKWLMWVPGQHLWDRGLTAFENGEYSWGAAYMAGMVAEQVMFALTLGQSGAAGKGVECAASTGTKALQPLENAVEATGIVRNVAGYDVWMNAGLVGDTYTVNIVGLYSKAASSKTPAALRALINTLRSEAVAAGAERISVSGDAVINQGITGISEAMANRFGLTVTHVSENTIILSGAL